MEIIRTVTRAADKIKPHTTIEDSSVTIEFGESLNPETLVSDYPFPDQNVIRGTLEHEGEVLIEGIDPNIERYDIEYRTGSKIITVSGVEDRSESIQILPDIGIALQDAPLSRVSFTRLGLWSFIFAGTQQGRIQVIDLEKNEYVDYEDIESLSRYEISRMYDLHAATVYYSKGSAIPFTYVKYTDDALSFTDKSTDKGREYVYQLFEKYTIDGQVLPDLLRDGSLIGGKA